MPVAETPSLACGEIRGGNKPVRAPVLLPGIQGVLFSRACDGGRGGDVHYISVCGSGLLSRICLADVAGHGAAVAEVGHELHRLIRKFVNYPDQRRVLRGLNETLAKRGIESFTTAVALTYYPPRRRVSLSHAGHPPGWRYAARDGRWSRLETRPQHAADSPGFVDGALAIVPGADFTRTHHDVERGDRMLLITDGVLETPDPGGRLFGHAGVAAVLDANRDATIDVVAEQLERALAAHRDGRDPDHDDVTFLLLEFTHPPPGPALWHVFRNRILRRLNPRPRPRRSDGVSPGSNPPQDGVH